MLTLLLMMLPALSWAQLPLTDCTLSHPGHALVVRASCGTLEVPLDHDRAEAGGLSLQFAVIPAENSSTKATPLFFFAGGPGQSAMSVAAILVQLRNSVGKDRDLVFIDQRGTGQSVALDCPPDEDLQHLISDDSRIARETGKCRDALTVDPAYFTSYQAVHDVELLRQALGYEKINLLGVSYGTRMAQLYLKAYPTAVRSVVLDGVIPLTVVLGPEFSKNLHASLELLLQACKKSKTCAQTFPQLSGDWQAYLQIPLREKRELSMAHPRTGKTLDVVVDREVMDSALRMLSYSNITQVMLPLLLHATIEGDWRPLISQALQVAASLESELSLGMHNSVICSEDVPFMQAAPPVTGGSLLNRLQQQLELICQHWPKGKVFADQHGIPVFNAPALLLSGELDPVTPPRYGVQAAKYFTRSRHIEVSGQGHNVMEKGCIPKLIRRFFNELQLTDERVKCVKDTAKLPFFIDLLGPAA